MLDILILFLVGRHIATIAKRKNRNPVGYVLLLVFSYVGVVFVCAIFAGVIAAANGKGEGELMPFILIGVLIGMVASISLSYIVVCSVSPLKKHRYDDYDDYDDEPARRGRYDEGDDYDRPRSRRREDDDEYRPRSRPREDDDYRPRRGPREDYE